VSTEKFEQKAAPGAFWRRAMNFLVIETALVIEYRRKNQEEFK